MVSLLLGTLTAAGEEKKPADSQAVISADLQAEDSFYAYLQQHNDKPSAAEEILLTAADAAVSEQNSSRPEAFLDTADVIKLDEQGYAEWAFEVPQDAVYRLRFTYCPTVANLRNPQMSLLLDGKLPYISAGNIELSKLWEDSAEEEYDVRGNQLQSEAAQRQVWQTEELFDDDGLLSEAHRLFLTAGRHTIRIRCERDGLAFTQLILHGAEELLSYEQLRQEYEKQQYPVIGELQVVQAEKINRKSDVQISAVSDFSDPMLVPYDVAKIRYNTMGGSTWSSSGQWVEYDVSVKESGLYALGFKFKQSIQQGMAGLPEYLCRRPHSGKGIRERSVPLHPEMDQPNREGCEWPALLCLFRSGENAYHTIGVYTGNLAGAAADGQRDLQRSDRFISENHHGDERQSR